MTDRTLDWRSRHDERSRGFAAIDHLPKEEPRTFRTWQAGRMWLDQGTEGACCGFATTAFLQASPVRRKDLSDQTAFELYRTAQGLDEWPGEEYSGTSVLAAAKAAKQNGYISSYYWAFGAHQLVDVLLSSSGAVLGLPWLDTMFRPRESGVLDCSGNVAGGHAIFVRGFHPKRRLTGEGAGPLFRLRNSWGKEWGPMRGDCYIRFDDMERLLADQGEACVLVP